MLYDITHQRQAPKVVGHFGRNGFFYTLDRTNGKFIKAEKYVNDLNWTKGIDPKTGKPLEYDPKLDVQIYNPEARALRGDGMKRACPTWHGGIAHQPLAYNPVKNIAYGVGTEGCFTQNGAAVASRGRTAASTTRPASRASTRAISTTASVTAFDAVNHKVIAKAVTDIEIRSGRHRDRRRPGVHRAAGRLDRRLQRRDARRAVALQRRHAAEGRAGHLRDRSEAVSRGADRADAICTR